MKLWIATPCIDGSLTAPTHESLLRLARATEIDFAHSLWNGDLVRVRSRAVHRFLETDSTHLLFVDSDVSFMPDAIVGMARAGVPLIGTPYPKKRIKLAAYRSAPTEDDARAALYDWPFVRLPEMTPVGDRMEVAMLPMGLTLIAREPLERMVAAYKDTLTFSDMFGDMATPRQSVALFQLMLRHGQLLPEDFSFCVRYTETTGERPWLYMGAGSPASHTGAWTFSGDV